MIWSVRNRLALIPFLVLFGAAAGCGDNTPKGTGQGGTGGGNTGMAGNPGGDGGPDAGDGAAGSDAGDGAAGSDAGDGAAGHDGAAGSDGGDGAAGSDAGDGAAGHDGGDATGAAGSDAGAGHDGGDASGAAGTDGGAGTGGTAGGGTAGGGAAGNGTGTGGAGTGGAGTSGSAGADGGAGTDGGTDVPPPPPACYSVTFTNPVDNTTFSAADDKNGDQCGDGFQHDVVISTGAPEGTSVQLFVGATLFQPSPTVTGGHATFSGVQIPSSGTTTLSIQFPTTMPCTDPSTTAKVTVDCSVPTCAISKPIISATHPKLNGVPAAQGGDRASANGSPYQVAFEVTTNIADNQTVSLDVDDAASPSTIATVTAVAAGGKAVFAGVPLPNDGHTYEAQARCTNGNGVVGRSSKGSYPVDITAPDLTVSKPHSGDFIGPSGLTNGAFQVCGSTTAGDAVGLPATLGSGQQNYCVSTTGSPTCVAAGTVGVDTCVAVPCPGDAPFGITVTLTDGAGNPTTTTLTGVTCSASTPTVQIITPVSDAPGFADTSKHLLAFTAPQTFRDKDGTMSGAQTDVVACTSRAGTASLFAGHAGDASLALVSGGVATVAAVAADNCPNGLGFVAKFTSVTLPESVETATGALSAATELRVDVTDVSSSTGKSSPLDLWVDTTPPAIAISSPANFCGSFQQASATFITDLSYATDTSDVKLTILNGSTTDTLTSPNFAAGVATFTNIAFALGLNHTTAVASDKAGNQTTMTPNPCDVTVGMAPVVLFTSPTSANVLCTSTGTAPNCINDMTPGTPGWQGSLTVQVLVGGVPLTSGLNNVTFSVAGNPIGTAPIDNTGHATLAGVTLNDGSITITATTDNVAGAGSGIGTVTVVVDLGVPSPPTGLTVTVTDRRKTAMRLDWTAPSDFGGGPIAGYEVRYAKVPITTGNFDNGTVTTSFAYTGSPSLPGRPDNIEINTLYIENGYFFGIEAVDAAGNRSALLTTAAATTAHFQIANIAGFSAGDNFGFGINGEGDLNGDGISDLLVGTGGGGKAYIYFGTSTPTQTFVPAAPSVTFSAASVNFGVGVSQIGDIDGDGLPDVAISDPNTAVKVYIYKGRATWPSTLTEAQADYVISGDSTYATSALGNVIARLGDFDGDGVNDFAISATGINARTGRVVIVKGKDSALGNITLPDASKTIVIDGDPTLIKATFGTTIVGIGHYFGASGTSLIVGSPGSSTSPTASMGHVYAFHGQPGTAGSIALGAADQVIAGPGSGAQIGTFLSNLGPVTGQFANVGIGNPLDNVDFPGASGCAFVMSGGTSVGPLTNKVVVSQAPTSNLVGPVILGGGLSGSDVALSLIGNSTPDVLLVAEQLGVITISDGSTFPAPPASLNTESSAQVVLPLPGGWTIGPNGGSLIPDINGDQIPDFALRGGGSPGKIAVYY